MLAEPLLLLKPALYRGVRINVLPELAANVANIYLFTGYNIISSKERVQIVS